MSNLAPELCFACYLFVMDCRQPLSKPDGWLVWGVLGVIAAPFVVGACATLVSAVGYEVRRFSISLFLKCHACDSVYVATLLLLMDIAVGILLCRTWSQTSEVQ